MILFEYDKKKYEKLLRKHAREEGLAEGREEGIAEGVAQNQAVVFYNMLADGIPRERAQRLAGLDDETAEALVREKSQYMEESL